jgi:hypothetical protein
LRLKPSPAALLGETGDSGIEVGGVAVDRHVEHVVAIIENLLNALAVVH